MDESGCTAVSAIITPTHIICANVGDSRCVVGTKGSTVAMTEDHKPSNGTPVIIFPDYSVPNTHILTFFCLKPTSFMSFSFIPCFPFYPSQIYLFLIFLSQIIHLPEEEKLRIEKAGGFVMWYALLYTLYALYYTILHYTTLYTPSPLYITIHTTHTLYYTIGTE